MKARIRGIGWVTGAGIGGGGGGAPFSLSRKRLPRIVRKALFPEPDLRFGRMDRYSKVGLGAITLALRDAGLEKRQGKRPVGVICATVNGCLQSDMDYFETVLQGDGSLASPNLFAYTLPNSFLGEAAIRFGLTGPTVVVNESWNDGLPSLGMALDALASGQCEAMLAGTCDLDSPADFTEEEEFFPGSIFFVLDRGREGVGKDYGEVAVDGGGRVSFQGREVRRYDQLVLLSAGTGAPPP